MKLALLLLFQAFLVPGILWAQQNTPDYCNNSFVRKIQRPVDIKNPKAGSFEYKFGLSERENPQATLVIFIPGGPGQTSMSMPLSYPYDFAVVRTDPRGVGCNISSRLNRQKVQSEDLARDILAIVRELKPSRYILHGISYGTVVATMAAALAESEQVPAPAAVVLEGVMAKAYQPNESVTGFLQNWQELKKTLPPAVVKALAQKNLPFGFTSKEWAAWLSSALIVGHLPSGELYAQQLLMGLDTRAPDGIRLMLQTQVKNAAVPPSAAKIKLYKDIICHELVNDIRDVKYDFDLLNGDLTDISQRLCRGIALDRPYDSARYQIKVPVYYFSGALDPITPPAQALDHFIRQTGPRTLVRLPLGGHQALSNNLADCAEALWLDIDQQRNLTDTLKKCSLKSTLQEKAAEISAQPKAGTGNPTNDFIDKLSREFQKIYGPEAKAVGGEFSMGVDPSRDTLGAGANRDIESQYKVTFDGGLRTSERVTPDALILTACHEIGHLFGGRPLRPLPMEWSGPMDPSGSSLLSAEGQADYYATSVCFRRFVQGENHQAVLLIKPVPSSVVQACDKSWGPAGEERLICQRAALASLEFLSLVKDFQISFTQPDPNKVEKTLVDGYPSRQCRLDTLMAGALCKASASLNFRGQDKSAEGCHSGAGARPACWYKK